MRGGGGGIARGERGKGRRLKGLNKVTPSTEIQMEELVWGRRREKGWGKLRVGVEGYKTRRKEI